jgi:MYXO-CTERM domain-containing protein
LANANAGADGHWWDTVTLTSSTLPAGTTVDVQFRLDLDATTVVPSQAAPTPYTKLGASFDFYGPDLTAFTSGTSSASSIVHLVLNKSFDVGGIIYAGTRAADFETLDYGEATGVAHFYIDVLTPGASLVSASGQDYSFSAAPVPKPENYAMFLAGLGLLGWVRRRKLVASAGAGIHSPS